MISKAALLLSVCALPTLALAQNTNLYTEDFGTWANLNNAPLSAVGWAAAAPNPSAWIIYNYGGISQFFTWPETASQTNAYYTTDTSGSGPSGNTAFVAINPAAYSNLTLAVAAQASYQATNETVRFAVRVGGQWYASATVLAPPGGTYSDRSLVFQPSATNWLLLTISSSGATIGGQPASALAGTLTGVGIVCSWSGAQGSWNFSNFRVQGIPPSNYGLILTGPISPAGLPLSWVAGPDVYLQCATNLTVSNAWERIVNSVGQSAMTVPTTAPQKFFRLATWPAIEKGSDISELTVAEQNGTVYQDPSGVALSEPLTLCKQYGWTVARIRLFVNPPMTDVQVNTLSYAVAQAGRAKAQGMKVLLDIHYSDNWNDPGYHDIPAAWAGQTYAQLLTTVSNYTVNVMNTFKSADVLPEYVQVGNEVGEGFLFPVGGKILFTNGVPGPPAKWSQFIGLVKAGIAGVKAAAPTSKTMIHIPGGAWPAWCTDYFDAFTTACPDYDLIGLSYYPFQQGSSTTDLADITATLNALHNRYSGKKLWIAETSYHWGWGTTNAIYPNTPPGQAAYASALCNLVASYSDGGGVCWWGGFYVANDNFPYSWSSQALFESSWYQSGTNWFASPNHRALPAFGSFAP